MKKNVKSILAGGLMASAVAGLFAVSVASRVHAEETKAEPTAKADVKCEGVNECKGKGECSMGDHDCKGKNACKGKGWMKMATEKGCTDKKGTVMK